MPSRLDAMLRAVAICNTDMAVDHTLVGGTGTPEFCFARAVQINPEPRAFLPYPRL